MERGREVKPPYKVPSLKDPIEKNGFKVISTFSGGGGSSTGYKLAGFDVLWANEFIPAAQETYRSNHPHTILDTRDIREITGDEILKAINLSAGELDIFDGSPPCASFSTAGKRHKHWGKAKTYSDNSIEVVDDLFFEYIRLLKELKPKTFVAENVSGLVKGTAKGYFKLILEAFKQSGYKVSAKLLNAAWLGVPQARQRVIFVGVRDDLGLAPVHPKPFAYQYSMIDACPWIAKDYQGEKPLIEEDAWMTRHATGREWLNVDIGSRSLVYHQLAKCSPYKPVPTITATDGDAGRSGASHPYECRKFSTLEVKRLCGFPDDYILTGTYMQQVERCGRSVPPLMMKAIAETIATNILRRL